MSIVANHIQKSFGDFRALYDVSLTVPTGQLVALLGPSGSGKTTLLRIIAGLEQADPGSGSILFHDEDVADTHVRDRGVGFVFQHYALFRHMTVFENIAFGLRVLPRRVRPQQQDIREKVHELLRLVQLDGLASRHPNQLSGGQRQRVALARALAVRPKVLLLDEPFGALDAKVRRELRDWLRRLHDDLHVTSVFVTHDQDEALEVADQIVVINKGRVEQIGTPHEVYHNPETEFVMHFLGEVNQFHCRIDEGHVRLDSIELSYDAESAKIGEDARVLVRPHDVTIDTKANGMASIPAKVVGLNSAGSIVRVELKTETGQSLSAELSQERFSTMQLEVGSAVYIRPRHIRVFSDSGPAR